jgi:hypothetical protein
MTNRNEDDNGQRCALWYVSHGSAGYVLCASEYSAAASAFSMQDEGDAAPMGVQFPDGRLIPVDDWPALREYQQQVYRRAVEAVRAERANPVPTRLVRSPFDGRAVRIYASEPEWIGDLS